MSLAVLSALVAVVAADTTTPKKTETSIRFTGDAGYVSTTGNSSVQTLNVGYKVVAKLDAWAFNQQFAVVHGKNRGTTVTSLWRGAFRADYTVQQGVSVYALLSYERNVFAGLKSRVSNNAGVAAIAFEDQRNKVTVEGGVSLTAQRGIAPKGRDLDFLGGRAATAYVRRLGAKASVSQSVELLPNFRERDDIRINTESALLAPITKQVGVKLTYVVRYDGLPEEGYQTTDRLFTSGIQVTL
jgi:putative salt-induced outer membrane protein